MNKTIFALSALLLTTPLQAQSDSGGSAEDQPEAAASADDGSDKGLTLTLPESVPDDLFSGDRSEKVLTAQVLLDRSRHSPGVIDGIMGANTRRAIRAYRKAHDLPPGEELSTELLRSLIETQSGDVFRSYTIAEEDVNGPFRDIPSGFTEMAGLDSLPYEDAIELLAEKFHMDPDFLQAMNPDADFDSAGTQIVVVSSGDEELEGDVARIEIDKGANSVRALSEDGTVLASYPATIGSNRFPSPDGSMQVEAVAPEPKYYFDPEGRSWGPDERLTLPAGPNNPVGGTWIDLSKEGYGIHGSPDPQMVGKRSSHGCVRLTNWDAEELGKAVSQGVTVEFV